jgi:WD40 repeat protein
MAENELRLTIKADSSPIVSLALSKDSQKIASGSFDNNIKIWNSSNGQLIDSLKGHTGPVFSLIFSRDNTKLISGSADKSVKIWQQSPKPQNQPPDLQNPPE